MTIRAIIPALFALMLITAPAMAAYDLTGLSILTASGKEMFNDVTAITYDASEQGNAISLIHFKVYRGSYVNFTLYYGSGSTVTGSAQSDSAGGIGGIIYTTSTVELNGESKSYTFLDTNTEYDYNLAGYAKDDTNQTGFIVYHAGYGSFDDELAVFMPVSSITTNLIYKVELTGSQAFDADITYGSYSDVASSTSKSATDTLLEWLNMIVTTAAVIKDTVWSALYWFKFLFIDNIVLVVALYLTGTMAFAAKNAKGRPDKFLRQWFKDQVALFTFIMKIPEWIVTVINMVRRTIL